MKRLKKAILELGLFAVSAFAAKGESFVSNFTYAAGPTSTTGSIWVVSRGNAGSGLSLVSLSPSSGTVSYSITATELLRDWLTPVQDGVFSDVTAEHRRTPFANAGKLGFVVPLIAETDSGYLAPYGYFSARTANAVTAKPLPAPKGEFPELS